MVDKCHANSQGVLIKIFCFLILILIHYAFNLVEPKNDFGWFVSFLIWCLGLFTVRRSLPLVIFFIFIFSYVTVPYYHFFALKKISFYSDFQSVEIINQVSFLNSLFLGFFSVALRGVNERNIPHPLYWFKSNYVFFYLSLFPCFIALIFGLQGESLLNSNYGVAETQKSPLHEYFILFYLFLILFHENKSKWHNFILLFMLILYCLKTMIYGGRVEVIQVVLLYCYLKFNFFRDISRFKIYILLFCCFVILTAIGFVRGNFISLLTSDDIFVTLLTIMHSDNSSQYVMTTSTDVYYASMRFIGLIDAGYFTLEYRVLSFLSFILNLFFSFDNFKELSNLAAAFVSEYRVGGGGLIGAYFYVWGGYIGVILVGLFLGMLLKYFHSNCNFIIKIYGIIILVTFPRWWAYTPINLTKMCVVALCIYVFYLILSCSFMKSKGLISNG